MEKIFTHALFLLLITACNADLHYRYVEGETPYPVGAVVAFDTSVCPTGWADFNQANGRIIFGAGQGNLDKAGAPLTSRSRGQSGGREYTTGIPASSAPASSDTPGPNMSLAGAPIYTNNTGTISMFSSAFDSNMPPFITKMYCKKTSPGDTVIRDAMVATTRISCASGWEETNDTAGRAILGAGSGNTDASGSTLTLRWPNDQGGLTFTPNIPACLGDADSSTPSPTRCLGSITDPAELYAEDYPDTTISGPSSDSNMPPFFVMRICRNTSNIDLIPNNSVVAFDLTSCPPGWGNYTPLAGRMIVGSGASRTIAQSGGLEYTTAIPISSLAGDYPSPANSRVLAGASNGFFAFNSAVPNTTINGQKADSNMPPFYVLRYCQKLQQQ